MCRKLDQMTSGVRDELERVLHTFVKLLSFRVVLLG